MGLFSRGKKEDILAKKQAELTRYTEQFDAAVSMVTSTMLWLISVYVRK